MKRMRCMHRHRIRVSDAGPCIASSASEKPMRRIGIASIYRFDAQYFAGDADVIGRHCLNLPPESPDMRRDSGGVVVCLRVRTPTRLLAMNQFMMINADHLILDFGDFTLQTVIELPKLFHNYQPITFVLTGHYVTFLEIPVDKRAQILAGWALSTFGTLPSNHLSSRHLSDYRSRRYTPTADLSRLSLACLPTAISAL
ncbi:hypothetical protein PGTUg99_001710 [Puccinia graminis f. sp. tritici]|uniref:Uncharacterized protein n=1 Tax=Puccinia graminis f. sp. tritici TaxID=56615 RepID=A0A5B0PWH1_PUCGR|nr:hypothetical protein PGTUg99_001710 [Puccinia graminis f. sp. tritici]